jgi:hypothetical protein
MIIRAKGFAEIVVTETTGRAYFPILLRRSDDGNTRDRAVPEDQPEQGYLVQAGAFAEPDPKRMEKLERVGPVDTRLRDDGLQVLLLGPYDTLEEAEAAREAIRKIGFDDAFIRTTD